MNRPVQLSLMRLEGYFRSAGTLGQDEQAKNSARGEHPSTVDLSSVAYFYDEDCLSLVVHRVDHSKGTLPDPVAFLPG